jgi:ribonuclease BN (tRNA processing enzyme)
MKIEVLGCYGNPTRGRRTTSFLVNDEVLFDAGCVTEALPLTRLRRISHVCLSHIHLDHVAGLCYLAELLSMFENEHLTVAADAAVIEGLSTQVFNNLLWPDFTAIPDRERPVVRLRKMGRGYTRIAGLRVKPVPVGHRTYATGFVVKEGLKTVVMTSDTRSTEEFWRTAVRAGGLQLIIAHVTFPSRLADLARTAGHMTLTTLLERIDTYGLQDIPVYVSHMKSMFEREIRSEVKKAGRENLHVLEQGSVLSV